LIIILIVNKIKMSQKAKMIRIINKIINFFLLEITQRVNKMKTINELFLFSIYFYVNVN